MSTSISKSLPSKGLVLVVEKDRDSAQILISLLDDEFMVDWANTCSDAILKVNQIKYDVILVDQDLPDGTGIEVINIALDRHPNLSAILLATLPDGSDVTKARDAARFLVLAKPIRSDAVLDWVRHNAATTQLVRLLRKIAGQQEKI